MNCLFFNTDNCNALHIDWKHGINKQNLEIVKSTNRNYNFLCTREFHLLRQVWRLVWKRTGKSSAQA